MFSASKTTPGRRTCGASLDLWPGRRIRKRRRGVVGWKPPSPAFRLGKMRGPPQILTRKQSALQSTETRGRVQQGRSNQCLAIGRRWNRSSSNPTKNFAPQRPSFSKMPATTKTRILPEKWFAPLASASDFGAPEWRKPGIDLL